VGQPESNKADDNFVLGIDTFKIYFRLKREPERLRIPYGDAHMTKPKRSEGERKALNVGAEAHELATKLAALRGLTVLELFDEEEVRDFFTHLLMEAMDKERARREGKR
jgi:hypothetical protein